MSKFNPNDISGLGLAVRLALTFSVPLLTTFFLAQYLGRLYGREALFTVLGVFVGLYIGFRQAFSLLLKK